MKELSQKELRAHLRKCVKDKYRNVKSMAHCKGYTLQHIYASMRNPPRWLLREFGIERRVEVVYRVTA